MRKIFGETDKGLVRATNQDRFDICYISDNLSIAVLCDGMGGENGGGLASKLSIDYVSNILKNGLDIDLSQVSESYIKNLLATIFTGANNLVYEIAQSDEGLLGMGTTMIIAILLDNTLYVGWVGDSRVYISSPDTERQVSIDHTVVQMLLEKGEITLEEATVHPKRHFITRAIGVSPSIEYDFLVEKLNQDEIVLLCSDGFYSYLEPNTLHSLLKKSLKNESVDNLIELAKESGGSDNITTVIMI